MQEEDRPFDEHYPAADVFYDLKLGSYEKPRTFGVPSLQASKHYDNQENV